MPALLASLAAWAGKHWKWLAVGAAAIAVFIGFQIVQAQRDEWIKREEAARVQRDQIKAQLGVSNASVNALQGKIDEQNSAIEQLGADSDARLLEGRKLILDEVRKGVAASQAAASLSKSPKTGGDQSKTSDAVMAARSLL